MSALPRLLVVDSSKVVRASLSKNLKGHFDIREEVSAELAWETLILDSSLNAVICGISLPKMDGLGLLEKIRSSRLERLKHLPFFLTASESMIEEVKGQALRLGASGFIPKAFGTEEMIRVLGELFSEYNQAASAQHLSESARKLTESDIFGSVGTASEIGIAQASAIPRESYPFLESRHFPEVVPREEIVGALGDRVTGLVPGGRGLGVLLLAMDTYGELVKKFGQDMADRIEDRFGQLLGAKLRVADKILKVASDRFAIVVSGSSLQKCTEFAERICAKLGAAEILVKGQRIEMGVSIGVACLSDDHVDSGEQLFALAEERLAAARQAGGNRVMASSEHKSDALRRKQAAAWLMELIEQRANEVPLPLLGEVGLLVLPVLRQMERTYGAGLALDKLEQVLRDSVEME